MNERLWQAPSSALDNNLEINDLSGECKTRVSDVESAETSPRAPGERCWRGPLHCLHPQHARSLKYPIDLLSVYSHLISRRP